MSSKSRNPLLTFLLSYHVWVTSKIQVNFRFERYWWYCLINCWNFQTIHVFEVRESIVDISTELPCLDNLGNPGRLPVQDALGGTGECILKIFEISWLFMFFGAKEYIADISTELPCLGDLENSGRLPVQDVFGGTGDCVLSIFEISSLFMFMRSGNPLLTFLLSYHVWVTLKIKVTFRFRRFSKLPKYSFLDKNALNL